MIVEGRQPRELTARRLLEGELPIEWSAQAAARAELFRQY
jgi:hypothetical protein